MALSSQELDRYLLRIAMDAPVRRDAATLQRLHQLHPLAIPFENLDSWLGRQVSLEPAAVFAKLVDGRRGGYCFEQNLLFREALENLGFAVQGLAARVVWNLPAGVTLPRTHMLLLVTVDDTRFIADVGFGGLTLTAPLVLDDTSVQTTPHENFRITRDGIHYVLQAEVAGTWQALYRFGLDEQTPADYAMASYYVGTHAQSRFVQQLIAGRPGAAMRHALLDNRYSRHYVGKASEQHHLGGASELRAVLQQDLGLELDALPELDEKLARMFTSHANQETER